MTSFPILIGVTAENAGQRLDAYLAAQIMTVSRAQIQRAIETGDISVNNRETKASYKVHAGDKIQVELPSPELLEAAPEPIPLEIVYEDSELIVINKPAGMVVHPGAAINSGTLANALVYHFKELAQVGESLRPGIVHRLDVGTSGLIIVAKTERAHLDLAEQFASRSIKKKYLALVYGQMMANEGMIDVPIGRDPRNRIKMAVHPLGKGRTAITFYNVRERFAECTLLEVEIKTGRTHQIRVHLAHLKHPVVGDTTYDGGRGKTIKDVKLRAAISTLGRPFLHAARLEFMHPTTKEPMIFDAPLPSELEEFLILLRSNFA